MYVYFLIGGLNPASDYLYMHLRMYIHICSIPIDIEYFLYTYPLNNQTFDSCCRFFIHTYSMVNIKIINIFRIPIDSHYYTP